MKNNLRIAKCCKSCKFYIPDGGNGYCDQDETYDASIFEQTSEKLWAWATNHATLKINICDDYKENEKMIS